MLTPTQIERFRQRAIADNTYYPGCPPNWDIRGQVVFVDNCTASISGNAFVTDPCPDPPGLPPKPAGGGNGLAGPCVNSIHSPGLLIWHCGKMDLSGHGTYVGIMYFPNGSDSPTTGPCAGVAPRARIRRTAASRTTGPTTSSRSSGGFGIWGAMAIDGNGCLVASSNGIQVQFDANVFNCCRLIRHRRPRAGHLARAEPGLKPEREASRSVTPWALLKRSSKNGGAVVGLDLDPSHIAAAEVHVNGSDHGHARRGVRAARRASCATARSPTAPALTEALKAMWAEHDLPKRVRLGIANQRIVVRTLDLPPLDDEKALAAAVRVEAPDHIPMPMDEAVLDFQSLGIVDDPRRPAHARRRRRRAPRDGRALRRRPSAPPA